MKLSLFSILAFITVALAATQPQKSIIVTYPDNTPDSIVDRMDPGASYILCPFTPFTPETWTILMYSRDSQMKSSLSMKSLLQKHSQIDKYWLPRYPEAKNAVIAAGGMITHEYKLIK